MSYSVDVNLLLYASDRSSSHHGSANRFLADCVVRPELFCLAWPTAMAYLRLATHPAIFSDPLTPAEAEANLDNLIRLPRVKLIAEGEGFWRAYREVTADLPVRGNLVPDAHLAALLLEHGVETLYTRDRDFLKFKRLRVRDPLAG
jgi:hypothetical protein